MKTRTSKPFEDTTPQRRRQWVRSFYIRRSTIMPLGKRRKRKLKRFARVLWSDDSQDMEMG